MGNCQAVDTATLVIQHPSGKSDKLYWPVCAGEVMKMNPGHHVALLISTTFCPDPSAVGNRTSAAGVGGAATSAAAGSSVRVTRIKLLRPTDTLVLGQVYRLITAQEVMKVLSAKKNAKMKKGQQESVEEKVMGSDIKLHDHDLVGKHERRRNQKAAASSNSGAPRPRTWQPSLHSISEAAS